MPLEPSKPAQNRPREAKTAPVRGSGKDITGPQRADRSVDVPGGKVNT